MKNFINIHTHHHSINYGLEIYNKKIGEEISKSTYFSVGIHPWFISQNNLAENYLLLEQDLQKENCLALGEIGLDKLTKTDFNLQQEVFDKQLEINKKYHKPVILHVVKAFQEIIKISKSYNYVFIIHGFNKKQQVADQLLNNGFYLSFGKDLLVKDSLQSVFKNTSLNRIFLETDAASNSIESVYKKAASIKEISIESLILAIKNNFENVFKCNISG